VLVKAPKLKSLRMSIVFGKSLMGSSHILMSEMIKTEIAQGTYPGIEAKTCLDSGKPLPNYFYLYLINKAMKSPECERGFILEGFPTTVKEAEALNKMLKESKKNIDRVIYLQAEDNYVEERAIGRLIHPSSGRIYHVKYKPPKMEGKDDVTGEKLVKLDPDTVEKHKVQMKQFYELRNPLLQYYDSAGLLARIDATKDPQNVWKNISNIL